MINQKAKNQPETFTIIPADLDEAEASPPLPHKFPIDISSPDLKITAELNSEFRYAGVEFEQPNSSWASERSRKIQ